MHKGWSAVLPAVISVTACGGGTVPSEGSGVAQLTAMGHVINVSVDRGDVYVILLDSSGSLRIAVERVRGSAVTQMPLAPTDWSDYAASLQVGLDPPKTALVSGGKAYFLGAYGVTVVPLDGSPSRTLYQPNGRSLAGHAHNSLGAFAVDGDSVYACDSDLTTNSINFGRFDANGNWELLVTGSSPASEETCFDGGMAVDAAAVYWSTSQSIRAYSKHDGTVTTVVNLGGLSLAPPLLAIGGGSLAWFDTLDLAFHVVNKKSMTPSLPAALGPTTLVEFGPADPAPFSMLATGDDIYWLTPFELHRLSTSGGAPDLLAHRPQSGGLFMGLATDGKNLYFTDTDGAADAGGDVTLRSVPL
jgi:hypothetical protein